MSDKLWTWREGLAESVELVNSYSTRTTEEEVYDAADIAFQGYRSLVVSCSTKQMRRDFVLRSTSVVRSCVFYCFMGEGEGGGVLNVEALESFW